MNDEWPTLSSVESSPVKLTTSSTLATSCVGGSPVSKMATRTPRPVAPRFQYAAAPSARVIKSFGWPAPRLCVSWSRWRRGSAGVCCDDEGAEISRA